MLQVDTLPAVEVAPGIRRRDLLTSGRARSWLIEFDPGSECPDIDVHGDEERYFVLDGEIVEDGERYPAGTYVLFAPGSSHRPRSVLGARILGINISQAALG